MLRLTYKIFPVERDLPSAGDLQTRKESDLVHFLHKAFSSDALPPSDLSLARRVLSSDVAETIVAGLLRDHLGGHPHVDEQAALKRREQAPPAAIDEEDNKGKRPKKKRDKGRKKDKNDAREHPSGVVHKTELSPPPQKNDRPLKERASEAASESLKQKEERSPETDEKRFEPKNRRQGRDQHSSADLKHASSSEVLEVVSAADLLNAEELSLLNGNHDDSNQRRRSESKQKPHPKTEDDRPKHEEQIFIDVGKLDGVVEDDFHDTLEGKGFPSEEVLFVRIRDTHSFIGVPPELLKDAVAALDGSQVGGLEVLAEKARPRRKPS
jgi:ATP-dependent RNA helicase DeaD